MCIVYLHLFVAQNPEKVDSKLFKKQIYTAKLF